MKKLIGSLCLVTLGLTGDMSINVSSLGPNSYKFNCSGAQGAVTYRIENLSQGIIFNGQTLTISNDAPNGDHQLLIVASDQSGTQVQSNLTVTVKKNISSNENVQNNGINTSQGSIFYQSNKNTGSQNGKGNTGWMNFDQTPIVSNNGFTSGSVSVNSGLSSTSSSGAIDDVLVKSLINSVKRTSGNTGFLPGQGGFQQNNGTPNSNGAPSTISFPSANGNSFPSINVFPSTSETQPFNGFPNGSQPNNSNQPTNGYPNSSNPSNNSPSGTGNNSNSQIISIPISSIVLSPSQKLDSIITLYSSTSTNIQRDYLKDGKYPTVNLPTQADPNLFNPNLINIQTNKAPLSELNRNQITPDDVILKSATQRYQNAIKGITNLLTIIDQSRADRNKAQNDITIYTKAYNQAVEYQRIAQNQVIATENRVSQIVSAMNSISSNIQNYKNIIAQASNSQNPLNIQKNSIKQTILAYQKSKAELIAKLNGYDSDLGNLVNQLSDQKAAAQYITDSVNAKTKQLNDAKKQLYTTQTSRDTVVQQISIKGKITEDLKKQLADAQKNLADCKIRLSDIDSKIKFLPAQIASLQGEISDLEKRTASALTMVKQIQIKIDQIKNSNNYTSFTDQIKSLDAQLAISRTRASQIDASISSYQGPIQNLKDKINQGFSDLVFLKTQKTQIDINLNILYQKGNDSNNQVAIAKQNLDQIILRFNKQSKTVKDATFNLEKARAEQALAKIAQDQLIARYSDALPYSIVPNAGRFDAGTTSGNNPSGSPLGAISLNGNGVSGSFKINNWNSYLSSAYGAGVNPAFPSTVTQLFPFNFLSTVNGNVVTNPSIKTSGSSSNNLGSNGSITGGGQTNESVNGSGQYNNWVNGGNYNTGSNGNNGNYNTGSNGNNGNYNTGSNGVNGNYNTGSNGINGGCGSNTNTQTSVTTGTITGANLGTITIRDDKTGQIYKVSLTPCSKLNANTQNYVPRAGDVAIVKGWNTNAQSLTAGQVTCLRN